MTGLRVITRRLNSMTTYTRMCIKAMKTFSEQFLHDWKYNINLHLGWRMHSRQPQSQMAWWHCLTLMQWMSKHLWIWMDLFFANILFLCSFNRILSKGLLHPLYCYMLFNIKYLIVVIKCCESGRTFSSTNEKLCTPCHQRSILQLNTTK